jgi:hypothetical protein
MQSRFFASGLLLLQVFYKIEFLLQRSIRGAASANQ